MLGDALWYQLRFSLPTFVGREGFFFRSTRSCIKKFIGDKSINYWNTQKRESRRNSWFTRKKYVLVFFFKYRAKIQIWKVLKRRDLNLQVRLLFGPSTDKHTKYFQQLSKRYLFITFTKSTYEYALPVWIGKSSTFLKLKLDDCHNEQVCAGVPFY